MPRQFKVISNENNIEPREYMINTTEEQYKHFQNVVCSLLQNAQDTWAEIWNEFQSTVVHGVIVSPEAERGNFKPQCGWPDFLEKMWLLKTYLDYTQKLCKGKE